MNNPFLLLGLWVATFGKRGASYRPHLAKSGPKRWRVELSVGGRSCVVRGDNHVDAAANAAQVVTSDPLLESVEECEDAGGV